MISLRKASEAQLQDAFEATLQAYRAALRTMGEAGARAFPIRGEQLLQNLLALRQHLNPQSGPDDVRETGKRLETELGAWSDHASRFYQEKTNELKEILAIVASATGEIAERDDHHAKHFTQLTEKLREANRLTDLTAIRTALSKSVTDISEYAMGVARAGQDSLNQLKSQLSVYERRLQEVERLAALDALTGLANRRKLETTLDSRIEQKRAFCVIYLDLNGFKTINDRYGHAVGDAALTSVADAMLSGVRGTDLVGRVGGDEFAVLFPETATDEVRWLVERIQAEARTRVTPAVVTLSFGVSLWLGQGDSPGELLRRADSALYKAKRSGRNQVVVWGEPPSLGALH